MGAQAPLPQQITLDFLHSLNLPADCLLAFDLDSATEAEAGSGSGMSSEKELIEVCPPPSDFQDVSHTPLMRIAYRDLIPKIRLFSSWLPISKGDQRHLVDLFKGGTSPWTCAQTMRISKGWNTNKESACNYIHAVDSFTGLHCPGLGLMVVATSLTPSRIGKHSGSSSVVSMVVVWRCPMDVSIWRLSSFDIGPVDD